MKTMKEAQAVSLNTADYLINPDKYVFPFIIKEKNKERTIITYNNGQYGKQLRKYHEQYLDWFNENIAERNEYSFAYHKGVRCSDALKEHLKSNFFIKLDIHKFFESITEDLFFELYGDYFNKKITNMIKCCFYKGSLSIGFVTSPAISDYFMRAFDKKMEQYVKEHPETHYSRYSDDILLSSEETDDDSSLNNLFELVKEELKKLHLEINPNKLFKTKLSYQEHNSLSYLGLGISKLDDIDNKVTISKRYILFLLSLIKKNKKYGSKCKGLLDEINSRVAYLAYNSPVSYARFQKKHLNAFGEEYAFTPRKPLDRVAPIVTTELPNYDEYQKIFEFEIHDKISNTQKYGFTKLDAITIKKYIGKDDVVTIPKFVDSIGPKAFQSTNIKEVIFEGNIKQIDESAFYRCTSLNKIVLPDSLRYIGPQAFAICTSLKEIVIPKRIKAINSMTFINAGLQRVTLPEGLKEIRNSAFYETKLEEITLPDGLEVLGNDAFNGCAKLNKVKLPNNLLKIDANAFNRCTNLKDIHLPETLLEIENGAFYGCSRLSSINIPDSVTSIGNGVFDNCPLLDNMKIDNNRVYSLNKNNDLVELPTGRMVFFRSKVITPEMKGIPNGAFAGDLMKELIIPEGIESIGVGAFENCLLLKKISLPSSLKEINANAFRGCISLKEIVIPNNVKVISNKAFDGCIKLEKVILPEGLLRIEEDAFNNDQLLRDINIPHSVNYIGKHAFKYCYGIKNLYISENLKKIHKKAFYGCSYSLETIKVSPSNSVFTSGQNTNTLIVRKTGELILGCKNSFIEYGVNVIYNHAFVNCLGLKKISLPKSTTIIQKGAFKGCLNLEKVDLCNVYTIGKEAFSGDEKITNIVLPESLTKLEEGAFLGTTIKVLRIPASLGDYVLNDKTFNLNAIEELYISAAMSIDSLAEGIVLPNLKKVIVDKNNQQLRSTYNGKEINAVMYANFSGDQIVKLGTSKTVLPKDANLFIGKGAFKGLNDLKSIHLGKNMRFQKESFADCHNLKEVILDPMNGINAVSSKAFDNCEKLEKVIIGEGYVTISANAFAHCKSLKTVVLPKGLKVIQGAAFLDCPSLKEIVIPDSVTTIDGSVFIDCIKLEKVTLPKGLKKLEKDMFKGCVSLKQIVLPNSLEVIGDGVFNNCKALKEINVPNKVKTIGSYAFLACLALQKVNLPKGLTTIGRAAFDNCQSLKSIALPDKVETIGDYCFNNCIVLKEIVLPKKVKEISCDLFNRCLALTKVSMSDNVKAIRSEAFKDCKSLKGIILPKALINIDERGFQGCTSLKVVDMPSKLIAIGRNAFDNTAIEKVILGKELQFIGDYCFAKCKKLKKVELGASKKLEMMPGHAFYGCDNLTDVSLPNKLKVIGEYAFAGCEKLKPISLPESVVSIKEGAFAYDNKIKEAYIPAKLEIFNNSAYFGCDIKKISVNPSNKIFKAVNNQFLVVNNVYGSREPAILYAITGKNIPSNIKTILSYAFSDASKGDEELILPESVSEIEDYAFKNWSTLKHLKILSHEPLYWGNYSFLDSPLENFVLPEETKAVGQNAFILVKPEQLIISKNIAIFNPYAFDKSNLKEVIIDKDNQSYVSYDSNVLIRKSDGELLINSATSKIPEGTIRVGDYGNAQSFDEVYIPESLESISMGAFNYNYDNNPVMVKKFVISKLNPYYMTNKDGSALIKRGYELVHYSRDGILPEGIKTISYGFRLNRTAKKLYIPSSLININALCNLDTSQIEEIEVNKDNPYFDSRDNCNAIIDKRTNTLLLACKKTKIPDSVTVIGQYAYIHRGIKDIYIPKHIRYINPQAFDDERISSITVDKENPYFEVSNDGHDLIVNKNYEKGAGKVVKHFFLIGDPELKFAKNIVVPGYQYDGVTKEEREKRNKKEAPQETPSSKFNYERYQEVVNRVKASSSKETSTAIEIDVGDDDMPF